MSCDSNRKEFDMNAKTSQLKTVLGSAFAAGALMSSAAIANQTEWTQFGDVPIAVYNANDSAEASCAAKKSEHSCAAKKTEQACAAQKKMETSCAAKKSEHSCAANKTEHSCGANKS
jgi:hypothetical protein